MLEQLADPRTVLHQLVKLRAQSERTQYVQDTSHLLMYLGKKMNRAERLER